MNSVERKKEEGMMIKTIKILAVIVAFSVLCNASYALKVGNRAPELSVLKWVRGKPVVLFSKDQKGKEKRSIYVVFFWATWSNSSVRMLNFVEKERKLFDGDSVVFVGMSKEYILRVKNFLKGKPNIDFSIGVDDKATTYDKYMAGTQGVPMFFIIGRDGKLAWKGSPFELENVLSRVVAGTFNIDHQNAIEKLRKDIRISSQTFNYNKKFKAAQKTLKIDSTDETAINIVVDHYIRKNQIKKSIDFVEKAREKAGGNKWLQRNLYLIELSVIKGMDIKKARSALNKLCKNFNGTFYNNPKFLNEISVIILKNAPYEIWPLGELLKMAERAVSLEKKNNQVSEKLGLYLQTLARMYYYVGWLTKAASIQGQVIHLLKDVKDKQVALQKKAYYLEALEINKKLN